MSERSCKFLIALAALVAGVTSACNTPAPQSGDSKPPSGGGSGHAGPFMQKDTPIIIADDGTTGPRPTNSASGIHLWEKGGTSWAATDTTNTAFTLSLGTFNWLIADGEYENLDTSTPTSFDIGKQTVTFNLNATPPTVTVTPKNASKDVCNIDASDSTLLHCNGKIHGNNASVTSNGRSHHSASDDGMHDYFLFVPQ